MTVPPRAGRRRSSVRPASRHRVVIVGGGIGGIILATRLGRTLGGRAGVDIVLADRALAHVWKPMLHTFASGTADYHIESFAFADQAKRNGYIFVPGTLAAIDRVAHTVQLDPVPIGNPAEAIGIAELGGGRLAYDTLVLAIGSRTNDFGTPGVAEHCLAIDDLRAAERFNEALRVAAAKALGADRDLRIAIVGGGATGVELAAELSSAADMLRAYLPRASSRRLRLILIESGPRLLGALPERVAAAAEGRLGALGIAVRLRARVGSADAAGFTLEGGERVDADLLVWTAGIRAPAALDRLDTLERTKSGQLVVRPTLQTTHDPAIFALGDCMSLRGPNGSPIPATAQAARQQAVFLAKELARSLRFGRPLRPFRFTDFGSIVSLGGYTAYGTLGRHGLLPSTFIEGAVAQLGHAGLYRAHQLELNGLARGGLLWLSDDLRRLVQPGVRLD